MPDEVVAEDVGGEQPDEQKDTVHQAFQNRAQNGEGETGEGGNEVLSKPGILELEVLPANYHHNHAKGHCRGDGPDGQNVEEGGKHGPHEEFDQHGGGMLRKGVEKTEGKWRNIA